MNVSATGADSAKINKSKFRALNYHTVFKNIFFRPLFSRLYCYSLKLFIWKPIRKLVLQKPRVWLTRGTSFFFLKWIIFAWLMITSLLTHKILKRKHFFLSVSNDDEYSWVFHHGVPCLIYWGNVEHTQSAKWFM